MCEKRSFLFFIPGKFVYSPEYQSTFIKMLFLKLLSFFCSFFHCFAVEKCTKYYRLKSFQRKGVLSIVNDVMRGHACAPIMELAS